MIYAKNLILGSQTAREEYLANFGRRSSGLVVQFLEAGNDFLKGPRRTNPFYNPDEYECASARNQDF